MKEIDALKPGQKGVKYKIGTFPNHTDPRRKPSAYSLWYNPNWKGCVEYLVVAATGIEARRAAMLERKKRMAETFVSSSPIIPETKGNS